MVKRSMPENASLRSFSPIVLATKRIPAGRYMTCLKPSVPDHQCIS